MARKKKKKLSRGGKLIGPSHERGGISAIVDNTEPIEVEGGEYIINKETVAAVGTQFLDDLNATATNLNPGGFKKGQLGNKSKYQNGGNYSDYVNRLLGISQNQQNINNLMEDIKTATALSEKLKEEMAKWKS